jgi:dTDP-4-amino-4,6-dideoxygalactose transaminase
VHYSLPVHRQPLYLDLGYATTRMPVAESMAERVLSLPVHPGLADGDLERIISAVREAVTAA